MSNSNSSSHASSENHEEHESPIRTPQQLIVVVALSFIVPIIVIVLLTKYVSSSVKVGAGSDALTPEAIAERIAPIGRVATEPEAGTVAAAASVVKAALRSGPEVYGAACAACHTAGVLGAPKMGDAAGWKPRLSAGLDALVNSSLKGKGAMPAQGGGAYSDEEIRKAVIHLVNGSGGSF
ncbi:MAG: c-type cytochrome [Burkholderiaceae bacterium]|jgi:cytochrome c5